MERYTLEVVTNSGQVETLIVTDDEDFVETVADAISDSGFYQSVGVIRWKPEKTAEEKVQFLKDLQAKIKELAA
ncbi:hypothetical protein [Arthronema virus TR020]|uniref:Uncharacterized protein n=1 Tax=Arthronema virus TR020 TaxID=2736280 RepID=A0A7G3WH32_9CAUD|nr:hypothetical protein [Arthronema virus TR020]